MSFEPYHHCLLRSTRDEVRIAQIWYDVLSCHPKHDELASEDRFFDAMTRAVTKWVRETESGQDAWQASGEDLNVGDLVNEIGTKLTDQTLPQDSKERPLWSYLADEGIHNVEIIILGSENIARQYTYDTVLVDTTDLRKD